MARQSAEVVAEVAKEIVQGDPHEGSCAAAGAGHRKKASALHGASEGPLEPKGGPFLLVEAKARCRRPLPVGAQNVYSPNQNVYVRKDVLTAVIKAAMLLLMTKPL